ncbi:MAG: UDP-N-acetylmuramoyl-tripeptide--D-alanyl-D-alanine ligase [Gammaproteobacteria bacterium]|nr:UDP-N-acetylmuramoyl-tripeptide--D-alanyl-D-alanine ligase [Gammaproteobacteria bacterium]MDH5620192.1 UDP-N-acetylmuramoyl-tripeptide--D-alanyl-D-alanine ligase [Gammaproteobacteria bacterium]
MIATLQQAADRMHGVLKGTDREFAGVSTDTRKIQEGELFFALQGPNFDGRDYVRVAMEAGAAGAVVSKRVDADIAQIIVDDAKRALGRFGAAWRSDHDVTVVGVTGSNGKTTLKALIAACLSGHAATLATHGNLNNDIGMPLMLTRIDESHRYAVLEMGANHAGEIAYLTALARPDVVVITNAGAAHLEGFGSIDGVARAKGEILQGEKRPRAAVLNADDRYFDFWTERVSDTRCVSFGFADTADVRADDITPGPINTRFTLHVYGESVEVTLPLVGIHNVRNACAAAAVAHVLDIGLDDIRAALERVNPVGGRLQPLRGINEATLFDDSYNANPLSVAAAAEFLGSLPGESWLVLGDMKELGDDAAELHREVGEAARASGVDRLFAYGDLAASAAEGFGEHASWYASVDALVDELCEGMSSNVTVLVKGSRSMRMERVVDALREPEAASREA